MHLKAVSGTLTAADIDGGALPVMTRRAPCRCCRGQYPTEYMISAFPCRYAVSSQAVSSYAAGGHCSLGAGIVVSAPVVSRRVGPAQWRGAGWSAGGSIIGPSGQ